MAEVLSPPDKSHRKHKIKDADSTTKSERKKKKRKLEDLSEQPSLLPSPPISDQSPTTSAMPTLTSSTSTTAAAPAAITPSSSSPRTLKDADISSPYALTTASRYLSISPAYSATPEIGIQRDHLDPLVFKYDSTLDGVVLSHQNLQFQSSQAKILGESPFAFVWCLVEFMLWKPVVGMVLEGWVNNVSPSHVGMLYGNVFSVAVSAKGIPESWKFVASAEEYEVVVDDSKKRRDKKEKTTGSELIEGLTKAMGRWVDAEGNEVEGLQKFVVTAVKAEGGMLSLSGSFEDEDLPEIIDDEPQQAPEKMVTQIHGKDVDDGESRKRKKEKKEKKKRKRERNAD